MFEPIDYQVTRNKLHVFVRDTKADRTYRLTGEVGPDSVVEPLAVVGYVGDADEDEIFSMGETYVNSQTPYHVYDGEWDEWHRETNLRGIDVYERGVVWDIVCMLRDGEVDKEELGEFLHDEIEVYS